MEGNSNLPSEMEISEATFLKYDTSAFNSENILHPHRIFVENKEDVSDITYLKDFIAKEKITKIILHQYRIEIVRYLESVICNMEDSYIKDIHMINLVDSESFKSDLNRLKNEFMLMEVLNKTYSENLNNSKKDHDKREKNLSNNLTENNTSIKTKNIVIDFREMSSKLPYYLYDFGFNLVVGSLDTGDYITSNSVCIERKSITTGDLFESLKSGRLTNQIVKMNKFFDYLIILCEFEDDLETDLNTNKTMIKNDSKFFKQKFLYKRFLELKTLSNKVHIFWSKNPKMTSAILNLLKNRFADYLDVNKCLNVNKKDNNYKENVNLSVRNSTGNVANETKQNNQKSITSFFQKGADNNIEIKEQSTTVVNSLDEYEETDDQFDEAKRMQVNIEKFIRKIDGINNSNFSLVFKSFNNLKEFVSATKDKLNSVFGVNGNKIFYFLNSRFNKNKK